MAKGKPPAFMFYPDSWLSSTDIMLMSPSEEGAFLRLLCHAWMAPDCGLPIGDDELSALSRLGRSWGKSACKIRHKFEERDGRLFNTRLLEERRKQLEWSRKSAEGGRTKGRAKVNHPSTTLQPPLQNGCGLVGETLQPNGNHLPPHAYARVEREKAVNKESLPLGGGSGKPSWENVNETLKWVKQEFPGDVNDFSETQLFIAVMETDEDLRLIRLNLPLWKLTPKWKDGYFPSFKNFISERVFKLTPKNTDKNGSRSKQQQMADLYDRS